MGSCLLKTFSFIDCYDIPFVLLFQYSSKYKTNLGGVVSFIVYLIILFFFFFLLVFLIKKTEENLSTFDEKYAIPPNFTISFLNDEVPYSTSDESKSFFLPVFFIYNKDKQSFVSWDEASTVMDLTIRKRKTGESDVYHGLFQCKNLFEKKKINELSSLLHTQLLDTPYAYCLKIGDKNETHFKIGGDYSSPPYEYMQIKFQLNPKKQFSDLEKYKIYFYYSEYSLTNEKPNKPSISYSFKQMEFNFLNGLKTANDVYITLDDFASRDNVFADWSDEKKIKLSRINKIQKNFKELEIEEGKSIDYLTFVLRSEFNYKRYLRTYKTFFTFLAQIGGFWKVLVFIGSLIVCYYTGFMMDTTISNQMYNMINPENKNEINKTYAEYHEKEEEKRAPAPLLKSINPILKQLVFEYYKYERNRGLEFTSKELFTKIFCFCVKSGDIGEKFQIFENSGKDIKECLEMSTIAKFTFETRALVQILLAQKYVMTGYREYANINYDYLFEILDNYLIQKCLQDASAMYITSYKQKYFIKGFTSMRSQGQFSQIDKNTINLLNLDENLVKKYFFNYYSDTKEDNKGNEDN